ncbi:unnamed protein product [Caenorhabditis bovis]|uniref:Uncharacterized protein n=1 Tax=Caenorhabditis bovis TaxID=2654633 RepID=A0A8S1FBN6_9PELO|nr:unnamed protein product [Caenorhabditis bovis]
MLFKSCLLAVLLVGLAESRTITVYNKCPFTIWPGILGPGNPAGGGFRLDAGQARNVDVDDAWTAGRIWARTGCDGNFNCETGFCSVMSLAEFTLKAWGGQDFYDVSLVDGYNIPVLIDPHGGNGCKRAGGCNRDINTECPAALAVKGRDGRTVACKSGCLGYNTDQECCRGAYGTPDKCHRSPTAQMFKDACPTAYSYAYDDGTSTFTCQATASYTVQFC